MANVYHDLHHFQPLGWKPYLGVRIGYSIIDGEFQTDAINVDVNDQSFCWQAMAGLSHPISNSVDLFTEYRFFEADFELTKCQPRP